MSESSSNIEVKTTSIVNHMFFGRRKIFTSEPEITPSNIIKVLQEAMNIHLQNRREIEVLYDYYKGKQDILFRTKDVRPEICNNVVVNIANQIVTFKVGYQCGIPMQYTAAKSTEGLTTKIETLNNLMGYENKSKNDQDVIEWNTICGTAYRCILPDADYNKGEEDEAPFELTSLRPANTFVIYSNRMGEEPLASVTYWSDGDFTGEYDNNGVLGEVFAIYTPKWYFEIKSGKIVVERRNNLGMIPIVEYPANNARLGAFEVVMSLLDSISFIESNRIDGLQNFVQAFLKFINCDIDDADIPKIGELGAVKVFSHEGKNADVDLVAKELSQTQTQELVNDLYDRILTICGIPSQGSGNTSDSSNNGASIVKHGWSGAETRAKQSEVMFEASEREFLKIALHILRDKDVLDLKVSDIRMVFPRRNYEDVQSKVQALVQMLDNPKIHPLEAYSHSGLFTDPEAAYSHGMEWYEEQLDKWEVKDVNEDDGDVSNSGQVSGED